MCCMHEFSKLVRGKAITKTMHNIDSHQRQKMLLLA